MGQGACFQFGHIPGKGHGDVVDAGHHLSHEGAHLFGDIHPGLDLGHDFPGHGVKVDRVYDDVVQQIGRHLVSNHLGHFNLCFPCAGPQVGRENDVGMLQERQGGIRGLHGKHIQGRPGHPTTFQGRIQIVQVDHFPSGAVDQADTRLHAGQGFGIDHVDGFLEPRHVQGDEIRLLVKGIVGHQFDMQGFGRLGTYKRVGGDHLHAQPVGQGGHHATDVAQPDNPQGFAGQFDAHKGFLVPAPLIQ